MPRRKYGRLIKTVEKPPNDNCSRCRAGKHCPLPGHQGNDTSANREWQGPENVNKRDNKKKERKKRLIFKTLIYIKRTKVHFVTKDIAE